MKKKQLFYMSEGTDDVNWYCGELNEAGIQAALQAFKNDLQSIAEQDASTYQIETMNARISVRTMTDQEVAALPNF